MKVQKSWLSDRDLIKRLIMHVRMETDCLGDAPRRITSVRAGNALRERIKDDRSNNTKQFTISKVDMGAIFYAMVLRTTVLKRTPENTPPVLRRTLENIPRSQENAENSLPENRTPENIPRSQENAASNLPENSRSQEHS